MSPTARTLKWLEAQGYRAGVVERHNTFSGKKHDLFNCIDVVAVNDAGTVGVQATNASSVSARLKKITTEPDPRDGALAWLMSPHRELWVVGWKRYAHALNGRWWRPVVREVTLADLGGVEDGNPEEAA